MSSNTRPCEFLNAVIATDRSAVGALRLPMQGAAEFVREFNQRYERMGWHAVPHERDTPVEAADGEPTD
jgi:hypothetical protein